MYTNHHNYVIDLFQIDLLQNQLKWRGAVTVFWSINFFNVQPSDFAVKLRWDMTLSALIMTYNRPLLRATYEVIPLHPSSRWRLQNWTFVGIKPGTSWSWVFVVTARPEAFICSFMSRTRKEWFEIFSSDHLCSMFNRHFLLGAKSWDLSAMQYGVWRNNLSSMLTFFPNL